MKTIELKVEDNSFDIVMTLLENLKSGVIKQLKVRDNQNIKNELFEVVKEVKEYKNSKKATNAREFLNDL